MKVLVFAVCAILSLASAEYVVKTAEDLALMRKQCFTDLKVDDEHVEQIKKWQYPNDVMTQCYLKCVFEKFGLFDEEKGFIVEDIHHQLLGRAPSADHSDDKIHGQIESCVKNIDKTLGACEKAYIGATCFFKNNLQLVQKSVSPDVAA